MTNHFIYSYSGNKRNEFKYLNTVIDDIDNYDTIIESEHKNNSKKYLQ